MRWFNSVVSPGLAEGDFVRANIMPFAITAILAAIASRTKSKAAMLVLLAWITFYMFANAIFHMTATLVMMRYCPGVITAVALYVPFCTWFGRYLTTRFRIGPDIVALIALLAGLPSYLQTYMVVFEGKRFF